MTLGETGGGGGGGRGGGDDDEGGELEALSCVLYAFADVEEVRRLLAALPGAASQPADNEKITERFFLIMSKYQEQPHLLDPHLEWILDLMLPMVRSEDSPDLMHITCKFLYIISKVRTYKPFIRLFPHEVADFEPVLALLEAQDPMDRETWQTRYILLLWLSMLSLIPFDLTRFDGALPGGVSGSERKPVMERVLDVAKTYLVVTDSPRNAAATLVAKFVTRPDVKQKHLPHFMDWSLSALSSMEMGTLEQEARADGMLRSLAQMFKHGKRDDFLPHASVVLRCVVKCRLLEASNTNLRKLSIKLVQRIGLTFLKPKLAAWRYQRGSRSLLENLQAPGQQQQQQSPLIVSSQASAAPRANDGDDGDDEDDDIPEEMEGIIEHLLSGLKDKDTVVRWSAAKGIGRVTGRLQKDLADDVVASILECLSVGETNQAWHGGCLALAELGRRGLLLPSRLPDVVPAIVRALTFDELRGACSKGSHVRDSACYVCWAFARAYDPGELAPFVQRIASALVITAVYDREVNCRRAASAAFQENVGRQGTFPHGIDIVTAADYFTLGNRSNSFLKISEYIAGFPEYTCPLIDHLVELKINHWDSAVCELAARTLHNLTAKAPEYMANTVLPKLLPLATGRDLNTRYGSILACAEVTHALSELASRDGRRVEELLGDEMVTGLKLIHAKLNDAKYYRGLGGELMRPAVCRLVEKLSLAKMPFKNDEVIDGWQWLIDDCLKNLQRFNNPDGIKAAAISALAALCEFYYQAKAGEADRAVQAALLERYLAGLQSSDKMTRCGFSCALGALPTFMLAGHISQVLAGLQQATAIGPHEEKFAEARRDAVGAIASVCLTVGVGLLDGDSEHTLGAATLGRVFEAILGAMEDYTMDARGDIGAVVREVAMVSLKEVILLVVDKCPEMLLPSVCEEAMCRLLQQAAEKIDRTREQAVSVLMALLHRDERPVPHIPHRQQLLDAFPRADLSAVNWRMASELFSRVVQILSLPVYQPRLLLGLTISVGGLTESTTRSSAQALFAFMKSIRQDTEAMNALCRTLLQIFRSNLRNSRVSVPLMAMLDKMLANGCFEAIADDPSHTFPVEVVALVQQELRGSKDTFKLQTGLPVFCGLIQFPGEARKNALLNLMMLLCHSYPIIRKVTASQLYETMLVYDDIVEPDAAEEIMSLLSDTNWDATLPVVIETRNQLCDLLGVTRPVLKAKVLAKPSAQ
ncbi:tubulin-specific chaperone D [Lethenteron reissneri]|uniref:tubulin-specific chaperone D n=1 Tax=Lethenteron reissneri TaxID=7753 RepID=UPI002AB6695B|nr:tubulin-specific chaperone D [Lethenteron reissneri]